MIHPIAAKLAALLPFDATAADRKRPAVADVVQVKTPTPPAVDRVSISNGARRQHLARLDAGRSSAKQPTVAPVAAEPQTGQLATAGTPSTNVDNTLRDLRAAFLTREGEDGFNAAVDFNEDGTINAQDLGMLRHKMTTAPGQPPVTIIDDQHGIDNPRNVLAQLRAAFLTRQGEDNFNAAVDFNNDGLINPQDLALARLRFEGHVTDPVAPVVETDDAGGSQSAATPRIAADARRTR